MREDLFLKGFDADDTAWNLSNEGRRTRKSNQTISPVYTQSRYASAGEATAQLQSVNPVKTQLNENTERGNASYPRKNEQTETRNQLVYNALESFEHGEYPSDSILETLGVNRDTARDLMERMMNRRITREDAYCVLNGTDDGQTLHYTPVTSTDSSQKVFQNRNLAVSSVGGNAQEYESLNRDKANSVTSNNVQRDLVSSAVESFRPVR